MAVHVYQTLACRIRVRMVPTVLLFRRLLFNVNVRAILWVLFVKSTLASRIHAKMAVFVHLSLMAHLHAHVRLASLAKSVNRILASQIHALTVVHALHLTRPASTVHVLVILLDLIARIVIILENIAR